MFIFKFKKCFVIIVALIFLSVAISWFMFFGNEDDSVNVSANNTLFAYDTVIIDPGHGRIDGGAVGEGGILEKDINLLISHALNSLLSLTNTSTVMTRTTDELLVDEGNTTASKKTQDLTQRVGFTELYENPLFISIHQNKFPVSRYSGLQVYYSKNNPESKIVAENIQKTTKLLLQNDNKREVKKAGTNIYVLKKIVCPAVLVECGFLSNPQEARRLCDDSYQKKIAICIFSALATSAE